MSCGGKKEGKEEGKIIPRRKDGIIKYTKQRDGRVSGDNYELNSGTSTLREGMVGQEDGEISRDKVIKVL